MPKVSVIIPIYNTDKYLRECINSVINQTLKDIEIICINDGSTDNSSEILNEYKSIDDRIIVINQKNQGVSVARNNGINAAKGEYIAFLDSDDYFTPNALYLMYKQITNTKSDIVNTKILVFSDDDNQEIVQKVNKRMEKYIHHGIIVDKSNYSNAIDGYSPTVWDKMFSKKFISDNNLEFLPHILHEDDDFWLKSCACFPNISYINTICTIHRKNKYSVTHNLKKDDSIIYKRIMLKNVINYIKKHCSDNAEILIKQLKETKKYNRFFYTEIPFLLKYKWTKRDKYLYLFKIKIFSKKN